MNTIPSPTLTPETTTPATPPTQLSEKIARLPKPTRDMISLMLEEGLPYRVIIDELAGTGGNLTPQSLTKWIETGYQDYLRNREQIEEAKTQAEFAADLLRELGNIDASVVHRACMILASIQIFKAIDDYGDAALRKMLHVRPASYLTLMNTLCNLTDATLKLEDHGSAH